MKVFNVPTKFSRKTRTPDNSPQNSAKTSVSPYNPLEFLEKYHEILKTKSKVQKMEISSLKSALFKESVQEKSSFSAKPSRFDELLTVSSKKSVNLRRLLGLLAELRRDFQDLRGQHARLLDFFGENREFLRGKLAIFLRSREETHEKEKVAFRLKLEEESNSKVQLVQEKYENSEKEQKDKLSKENARKDEIIKQYQRLFKENAAVCADFEGINPSKTRKNADFSKKYAEIARFRQEIAEMRGFYEERFRSLLEKVEEIANSGEKVAEKQEKVAKKPRILDNFEVFEKLQENFKQKDAERRCFDLETRVKELSAQKIALLEETERLKSELSTKTAIYNEIFKQNLEICAEKRALEEKLRDKDCELQIKSAIFQRKEINAGELSRKFKRKLSPLTINYELIKKI